MKLWLLSFFFALSCLGLPAQAKFQKSPTRIDDVPSWRALTHEQQAVASWVHAVNSAKLSTQQVADLVKAVYAQAKISSVDPVRLFALIRIESRFNARAESNHGAKGLMQVLARVHQDKLKGRSPYNPYVSLEVGTRIYQDCADKARDDFLRTMSCYSGGGGHAYAKLVRDAEREMRTHVLAVLFHDGPGTPRETWLALN